MAGWRNFSLIQELSQDLNIFKMRTGKISDDLRREALYLAGGYRDKALMDNDYAADGYARDMELEYIYAEAEKRLK